MGEDEWSGGDRGQPLLELQPQQPHSAAAVAGLIQPADSRMVRIRRRFISNLGAAAYFLTPVPLSEKNGSERRFLVLDVFQPFTDDGSIHHMDICHMFG